MHRFSFQGERKLFLLTAGNLATTQAVITQLHRDIEENLQPLIRTANYVGDIADYIGSLMVLEKNKYTDPSGPDAGIDAGATFILGGQIKGHPPELYLIYPEGNHITASQTHPYLQIGEVKYGKPILDRIIQPDTPMETALRCAIVSLDSTMRSNSTVGPPLECLAYNKDTLSSEENYAKLRENDDYLVAIRESWEKNIREAVEDLPNFETYFSNNR
tara:strand:- start:4613 stop:5263 length:651 start_codon:yes stop_codon:yes gene_type:complete